MRIAIFAIALLALVLRLPAQTNTPVHLALISITDEASSAADLLTAKLSGNPNIQLLERDQITAIYHEQALSAGNADYVKLGRTLGADGLVLLDITRSSETTNLAARFIAVKPGVILADGSFTWPVPDATGLVDAMAGYLDKFLPKLALSAGEAIPLSVVNLRSPVATAEAQATEQRLTLLTIQRLSEEPRLFVLERQKMALLANEKNLKADDSAFWNGSYLLDGVMDQNGYSPDRVTINARLTPPNGGSPVLLDASGPRNDLAGVINQLTAKIMQALKLDATVKPWNSTDEAAKYYSEAQWALRWGAFLEAESAADSAWALGKQDLDCATVRVRAYMGEALSRLAGFQSGGISSQTEIDPNTDDSLKEVARTYPACVYIQKPDQIIYDALKAEPDAKNIDCAYHALELYYEFCRASPDGLPKVLTRGPGWEDWHNSDWYQLGIDDLATASRVLSEFNVLPRAQQPVADKLAELRALARTVAVFIAASPTVHDSYFVGDRIATYDELDYTMMGGSLGVQNPNIFACEVNWGCFWQETPEEAVEMYRQLMKSAVFCYLNEEFWFRQPSRPHVVGWDDAGRRKAPAVWNSLVQELNISTNVLLRMEGRALKILAAKNDVELRANFTGLMDEISTNREELVVNNVDLFYLDWRAGDLLEPPGQSIMMTPGLEQLQEDYRTNYSHMLDDLQNQYQNHTALGDTPASRLADFEKEKQFLQAAAPFNSSDAWFGFIKMFQNGFHDYSQAQAREIKPLFTAYRSNLVAQAAAAVSASGRHWPLAGVALVDQAVAGVDKILNIPAAPSPQPPPRPRPQPVAATPILPPPSAVTNAPEIIADVVTISTFLPLPLDDLAHQGGLDKFDNFNLTVTCHQWLADQLVLNFNYGLISYQDGSVDGTAIGILNPTTGKWTIIPRPKADYTSQTRFYFHSVLLNGELFDSDGGQIRKYDPAAGQWQALAVSDGNNYQLFAVNGHLYAASFDTILEILDDGTRTRVLVSARRQPPASVLDTQSLGTPTLFEGPNHSLRVSAAGKLYTWMGSDWHEDGAAPPASGPPTVHPAGLLFRQTKLYDQPTCVSRLRDGESDPGLCLWQRKLPRPGVIYGGPFPPPQPKAEIPKPLWQMPDKNFFAILPATLTRSNLYLLATHANSNVTGQKDGDAELFCFSGGFSQPQKVFLKFAPSNGSPVTGPDPATAPDYFANPAAWIMVAGDQLFLGLEQFDFMGPPNGAMQSGPGRQAGIWMLPLQQLDPAIAAQQSAQRARRSADAAAVALAQKKLLDKYDLNHNGIIDPEERAAALDDPDFIASQIDIIDANHNGMLDPAELDYFDPNHDHILTPKAMAGIRLTLHLLARKDLAKFDADGNGYLDREEFQDALRSGLGDSLDARFNNSLTAFWSVDSNRDGKIDVSELEAYLNELLHRSIRPKGRAVLDIMAQAHSQDASQSVDRTQVFKLEVENYWRNPASVANPAARPHLIPGSDGARR